MEKFRLMSMTDFVLKYSKTNHNSDEFENTITDYANFLNQPLKLEMFVPCDDEGNVLETPKTPHTFASENCDEYVNKYKSEKLIFDKAKEKVLFEGFEWDKDWNDVNFKNISINNRLMQESIVEDLIKYQPELTETALKQIGL